MWYTNAGTTFVLSQITRFDRQTDGQTNRQNSHRYRQRLHSPQRGKIESLMPRVILSTELTSNQKYWSPTAVGPSDTQIIAVAQAPINQRKLTDCLIVTSIKAC